MEASGIPLRLLHSIRTAIQEPDSASRPRDTGGNATAQIPDASRPSLPNRARTGRGLGFRGKEALKIALKSGVNVVDTSAHFGSGRSEMLIGDALHELIAEGSIRRDEVILITKCGYVLGNGQSKNVSAEEASTTLGKAIAHSLAPEFLEEEITKSLERLGVTTADIVMLNNPERMLHAKTGRLSKQDLNVMLRDAFEHLEKEVQRGRIAGYGVSSNTVHLPSNPDHIALSNLLTASAFASSSLHGTPSSLPPKSDHFIAIGYPLNLFERESVEPSIVPVGQSVGPSLATEAAHAGLYQVTQRPMFVIAGEKGSIRCLGESSMREEFLEHYLSEAEEALETYRKENGDASASDEFSADKVPRPPPGLAEQIEADKEAGMTDEEADAIKRLADAIQAVANLEIELTSLAGPDDAELIGALSWSDSLSENLATLTVNPFTTRHYLSKVVLPAVRDDLEEFSTRWASDDDDIVLPEPTPIPSPPSASPEGDPDDPPAAEVVAHILRRRPAWLLEYRLAMGVLAKSLVTVCTHGEHRANRDLARVLRALAPSSVLVHGAEPEADPVGGMAQVAVKSVRGALRAVVSEEAPFTVLVGMEAPAWAKHAPLFMKGTGPTAEELQRMFWCPLLDE
ncbi:hypothetical protein HDU96_004041 [Phlyctochytrium bullatum]|nr:hypothetical protein HDU96_004041 [Phlyctochytrium bullatum]